VVAGFVPASEGLHRENGGTYLAVDGTCRYFANFHGGETGWPEVHSGALTPAQLDAVLKRMRFTKWPTLGNAGGGNPDLDHYALSLWSDGQHVVTCTDACRAGDVEAMSTESQHATEELWRAGKPWDGPVRISMVRDGTSMRLPAAVAAAVPWPLTWSVDAAVLPQTGTYPSGGMGLLVDGASDAEALRSLRRRFQDGTAGNWWYGFIPIKERPELESYDFILHVRDAVPYEDRGGLIPLTW
jgi:hypothetical protein